MVERTLQAGLTLWALRWGDYPSLSGWAQNSHKCPQKMEAEEGMTIAGEGNALMATETAVMQPQPRKASSLQNLGQEAPVLSRVSKETSPADTLILSLEDSFQISDLLTTGGSIYCFKPPSSVVIY